MHVLRNDSEELYVHQTQYKYQIHPQHILKIHSGTAASRVDLQCDDELLSVNSTPLTHTPLNTALVILQEVHVCTVLHNNIIVLSNAHSKVWYVLRVAGWLLLCQQNNDV